jgi:uncharacterized membrane protein YkoI
LFVITRIRDIHGEDATAQRAVEKAKVSLPQAMAAATKVVPDSRVVRLELVGGAYEVVVAAGDALRAFDIDARTGEADKITAAKMDEDEFKDAKSVSRAMAAARISLADAVRLAEEGGGKAVEAEIKMVRGQPRYEVKVVRAGSSAELTVDALKGEVVKPRRPIDGARPYRDSFPVDKASLVSTGRNPYLILEPGHRRRYVGGNEAVTITVLQDTRMVDGVETRVVEEREETNGELAEVSRNYLAIDKTNNDVYYFGEDVDIYRNGKVVDHEGAWLSGVKGARFGLLLPGRPEVGDRFYQEMAPSVAMDRAEIVGLGETIRTPAGTFHECLSVKESSPLESDVSKKWYATGIGLVRDDELLLVKVEDREKR